ncbi:hypothetical protein HYI36_20270 [Bacillus sp. Gen3]|nr:hypothetical protein [Bacillus sp. Gen3]
MWRKLFKPFGARVVVTVDFDGEVRYRFATFTPDGVIVRGIGIRRILKLNGSGSGYISKWYEI